MIYKKEKSKTYYGVRWLDNCIIDGIGWFQYAESLSNKPLHARVKRELKGRLRLLKASPDMTIKGPPYELRHVARLMDVYMNSDFTKE